MIEDVGPCNGLRPLKGRRFIQAKKGNAAGNTSDRPPGPSGQRPNHPPLLRGEWLARRAGKNIRMASRVPGRCPSLGELLGLRPERLPALLRRTSCRVSSAGQRCPIPSIARARLGLRPECRSAFRCGTILTANPTYRPAAFLRFRAGWPHVRDLQGEGDIKEPPAKTSNRRPVGSSCREGLMYLDRTQRAERFRVGDRIRLFRQKRPT